MTGTVEKPMSADAARAAWMEHRFFRYRGCAPDGADPRVLAARPDLPVDTHFPADRDGPEPQGVRVAREAAAVELCLNCPVMVWCDRYANSVTSEGKLAQPDGVWGGRLAKERREAFKRNRHRVASPAPDVQLQTGQKHAVLLALAMCPDGGAESVAAAAGVDARTANWQRSRLVTQLNLSKASATRMELLAEAVRRGLLDVSVVVADDGSVPAWSPAAPSPRPAGSDADARVDVDRAVPVAPSTPAPSSGLVAVPAADPIPYEPVHVPAPRRDRFTRIVGQLTLWEAELADVHTLFPVMPLEAAA